MLTIKMYYAIKPFVPRRVLRMLRTLRTRAMAPFYRNVWPILPSAAESPQGWSGWPEGKSFALVLTHDVETDVGQKRCERLIQMEQDLGFRSAFYFVPERYHVRPELRRHLTSAGFEVGVHGLKHDGKLYSSAEVFRRRAARINHYLKEWESCGFRSPAMHHNLDWLTGLNVTYDASTFDTDPFEPEPSNAGTIFPFWVPGGRNGSGYVELPYTLPQDSTLFRFMGKKEIGIWKTKLDWIAEHGGMAHFITHPDYMVFDGQKRSDTYPIEYYSEFLHYIKSRYEGQYWHALPREVASFWIERCEEPEDEDAKPLPETATGPAPVGAGK